MKTNSVPAIIMLTAGLIDCVLSIYYRLTLFKFTAQLLLVLIVFYLLGCAVKLVLDINFPQMDEASSEENGEESVGEEAAEAEEVFSALPEEDADQVLENINSEEGIS